MPEPGPSLSGGAPDRRRLGSVLRSRLAGWLGLTLSLVALGCLPLLARQSGTEVQNIGSRPIAAGSTSSELDSMAPAGVAHTPRVRVRQAPLTASVPPALTGRPERLSVPSLGIDAAVDPVGVRADRTVDIPDDAYRVGWYRFGSVPGEKRGSAVVVGHVDSRTQGRGALYPLRAVALGARITVAMADGQRLAYRVVSRELIGKRGLPATELFARTGPPRLTIITCGGPYDAARGGYQDNLVVTAVPA